MKKVGTRKIAPIAKNQTIYTKNWENVEKEKTIKKKKKNLLREVLKKELMKERQPAQVVIPQQPPFQGDYTIDHVRHHQAFMQSA